MEWTKNNQPNPHEYIIVVVVAAVNKKSIKMLYNFAYNSWQWLALIIMGVKKYKKKKQEVKNATYKRK